MAAYVIVDIEVTDPIGYEEYKKLAPAAVELSGGRYIARGSRAKTLEGDWTPNRLVILQCDTSEQAKKWLNSDEYREARSIRHKAANSRMVVIEGV